MLKSLLYSYYKTQLSSPKTYLFNTILFLLPLWLEAKTE